MDHPSPHCQYHVRCLKAGVRTWPMRFASWYMGLESPSACLFTAASPPPSSPPKPSFCRTAPISWQLSCQWRNYQGSLWKKRVDICLIFLDISTRIFCKINSYSYCTSSSDLLPDIPGRAGWSKVRHGLVQSVVTMVPLQDNNHCNIKSGDSPLTW